MKSEERQQARSLRLEGKSIAEIRKCINAAKSTVSLWIRDIELTEDQKKRLAEKGQLGRERFSQSMREQRLGRWEEFWIEAEAEYQGLSKNVEFMFGLALYIGEGEKHPNRVSACNCNPHVIYKLLKFFEQIGADKAKVSCCIHLHSDLSIEEARRYWQAVTDIPDRQVKTVVVVSRSSQRKKGNIQPYGTCHLSVYSTRLSQKMAVWMRLALTDAQISE